MLLMNTDIPVLWFDPEDYIIKVLWAEVLPYALRDNIRNSTELKTLKEHLTNFDKLRHFFADRVLTLSRENAKSILQSLSESQKLTEEQSYQLSLRCRGLSISDNFWVKADDEEISFSDVNIRNKSVRDSVFQVSMKGTPISLQHNILAQDVSTRGMFRKTWVREDDGLYLYKSDNTYNYINTRNEILVSQMLDSSSINHVRYTQVEKDGVLCCKCKCFTNDYISFVEAEYIIYWLRRRHSSLMNLIHMYFKREFANMVVCDYLFANPDRHNNNWGFLVSNHTGSIQSLAPLFDHNQALIAFELGTLDTFDELIYEPTGKTMLSSALEWYRYFDRGSMRLPDYLNKRLDMLESKLYAE